MVTLEDTPTVCVWVRTQILLLSISDRHIAVPVIRMETVMTYQTQETNVTGGIRTPIVGGCKIVTTRIGIVAVAMVEIN